VQPPHLASSTLGLMAMPANSGVLAQGTSLRGAPSHSPAATSRRSSPTTRRALMLSVAREADGARLASAVEACTPDELVWLALAQGVAGRAVERLGPLLPAAERGRLVSRARQDALRHLSWLGYLRQLGDALDDAGVTWVVLKGPALAELSYMGAPRGYTDLDLLVSPGHLERAVDTLARAGAQFAERNWPLLAKRATGEVLLALPGGEAIDLHWHLLNQPSARQRFQVPSGEILERRRRARLGDVEAWVLEPTDFALHVTFHASASGGHRLSWLLDVERTAANCSPDWELFVQRGRAWRAGMPLSVGLERARRALGAAIPEGVVAELAGTRLNSLAVRRLGEWLPAGRLPGGRSWRNGFTRCLRDSVPASVPDFARETWVALVQVLRPGWVGADDPKHLVEDVGGRPGFERYAEMARQADRYGRVSRKEAGARELAG